MGSAVKEWTQEQETTVNTLLNTNSSGSVCLDVINQTWSPMYDMINIFEVFLPQLLRYPNPADPLNGEAAALLLRDAPTYNNKVKGKTLPLVSSGSDCFRGPARLH